MEQDPLDAVLGAKEKLAVQAVNKDHKLWEQWKKTPTHDNMDDLMGRFEPLFASKTRMWKAPNVNQAAFLTNLRINAVDAFQTYNPNKGAALRTHLEYKLNRTKRFNIKHQNYARMPEEQVSHIGRINKAKDFLQEDLGRDPTPAELIKHVNPFLPARRKLTEKRLNRILDGQRKDVVGSTFASDPTPHAIQREREVASLLRPDLSGDQQQVFDHLYGRRGKEKTTSTTRIAKHLGKSPSQVSRMRTDILKKFDTYM